MAKTGRGSGRPPKPRLPLNALGLPQQGPGHALIKVPLGVDGEIDIARITQARVARMLSNEEAITALELMVTQGLRVVVVETAPGEFTKVLEAIGAAEQLAAIREYTAQALKLMQLAVEADGRRRRPGAGPEDADAINALRKRYGASDGGE